MQRVLSTVVLLGLLLASAAAFAITEHLKLIKSPIYATHVTKVFSPATGEAEITFSLRRSDSVTVTIVSSGKVVDTLATGQHVEKGRVTFHWDGRNAAGAVVPDGSSYQPQIELGGTRTIRMPNTIAVDTSAPEVVSASAGDGLLVAGGRDKVAIHYVLGGRARAAVYVAGSRVILTRSKQPSGKVKWNGKRSGHVLPPGRYVLEVAAVDNVGNATPPAERKRVVVRISAISVELTSPRVTAGAHFTARVRTGAKTYAWTFAGKHGSGTTKRLALRAPSKPGRYRLVVSEHGHSASAVVIVGKK